MRRGWFGSKDHGRILRLGECKYEQANYWFSIYIFDTIVSRSDAGVFDRNERFCMDLRNIPLKLLLRCVRALSLLSMVCKPAYSKSSLTPAPVFAEVSKYFKAPILAANLSAYVVR